jgi:hypothetical protein
MRFYGKRSRLLGLSMASVSSPSKNGVASSNGTIYTTDDNAPFNKPFHFILELGGIGGNFDSAHTTPDADFEKAEMKVDYVRLYSQA